MVRLTIVNLTPRIINVTRTHLPINTNVSLEPKEVRRRALNLYKSWYRQIPIMLYDYHLEITNEEARSRLREIFVRNSMIQDVKVTNSLVLRGEMELNEMANLQKEPCHVLKYFNDAYVKPKDFLSKFLEGR